MMKILKKYKKNDWFLETSKKNSFFKKFSIPENEGT